MMTSLICSACQAAFVPENQEQKEREMCGVCILSQKQKPPVEKPQEVVEKQTWRQISGLISKLSKQGLSKNQIAGKIGYSKTRVIEFQKGRKMPKLKISEQVLKKLKEVELVEPNKNGGGENDGN